MKQQTKQQIQQELIKTKAQDIGTLANAKRNITKAGES